MSRSVVSRLDGWHNEEIAKHGMKRPRRIDESRVVLRDDLRDAMVILSGLLEASCSHPCANLWVLNLVLLCL